MSNKQIFSGIIGAGGFLLVLIVLLTCGFTVADETEHCFKTRYGRVIDNQVSAGIHPEWWVYEYTCIPMRDQQIPHGEGDDGDGAWMDINFETADRMGTTARVRAVVRHNPGSIVDVFLAKRTHDAIMADVRSGVATGAAQGGNSMTLDEIFDGGLNSLQEKMKAAMQDEIGRLADVVTVYVQQPSMPAIIRQARIDAREAEENIREARQTFVNDSIAGENTTNKARLAAEATVSRAQAYADSVRLTMTAEAVAFTQNRALAELRGIEANAKALENLLGNCTSNCVIGADLLTKVLNGMTGGR